MAKLCITGIDWAWIKPEDVIATWTLPTCRGYSETDWYRAVFIDRPREPVKKKTAKVV